MKREGYNHAKLKLVARDLKIPLCFVRGVLESIWHETAAHFPAGDIGRYTNEELAIAIDYDGDADELVAVLVKRRLLDEMSAEQGRLYVHDWHEHCDDTTRQKLRNRQQTFANGLPPYGTSKNSRSPRVTAEETLSTENHREEQKKPDPKPEALARSQKPEASTPPTSPAAHNLTQQPAPGYEVSAGGVGSGEETPAKPDPARDLPRLPEADLKALEALAGECTKPMVLSPNDRMKLRELWGQGCTLARVQATVEETIASKPKGWRAGSLCYFLAIVERQLGEKAALEAKAAPATPAVDPNRDPGGAITVEEYFRRKEASDRKMTNCPRTLVPPSQVEAYNAMRARQGLSPYVPPTQPQH